MSAPPSGQHAVAQPSALAHVASLSEAFEGLREQIDHLHILLRDAESDFPPLGIDELTAASLEEVARWSLQFRSSIGSIRDAIETAPIADGDATAERGGA